MADTELVEKRLSEEYLDSGEIPVGEQERLRLGLGRHSEDVTVRVGPNDEFTVHWAAGRGRLGGDQLRDYLQETARVGFLVRLVRRDDALALAVVETGATTISRGAWWTTQTSRPQPAQSAPPKRRTRMTGTPFRLRPREDYTWRGNVGFLRSANQLIRDAVDGGGWDPAGAVAVRLEGERLATLDQFEELLAIDVANIDHLPHQEAAARTVLARMNGRGILADEVGLGKTIEAGLIIKELLLRGLANRILVLCPAPLRDQWQQELKDKFDEAFTVVRSGSDRVGLGGDKVIMTQVLATRNLDKLVRPFDLVVIDEAHRLAGANAHITRDKLGALVAESPRALLLSATPVQNSLLELYRLVEVLRPGTFRSQREFTNRFVDRRDPRRPVNPAELRKLVSSVIVRTTRAQAGLDRVRRMPPRDVAVRLGPPERRLYDLLLDALRHKMSGPGDIHRRRLLALRLTASPPAVSRMALRMAQVHPEPSVRDLLKEVAHLAADIAETERDRKALRVIDDWINEHGRVLVFSQHTQTVAGLVRTLGGAGIEAATFHGDMSHSARAESIARFRAGKVPVLISTDAGAEGLNLQFCNCILNFDLPWNPMRVEQRIGRVHRLTQERDVHIANLFAKDTIDESVYRLLHDKLAMFELLFGQVVTVLGELDDTDQSMEGRVLEAVYSDSDQAMQTRLDELGQKLEAARKNATEMIRADSNLSGWLAEQAKERSTRSAAGDAKELMPQARSTERRRQADVESFIRRYFDLAGVTVTYEAPQFASVVLSPRLSVALDGLTELHLAFSHRALEQHPAAELCVVGSEFFGLLMSALRDHGDLTGTTQQIPEVSAAPVGPHAPWVQLISRQLRPAEDWSARATYRVQEGTATGKQDIAVVSIGDLPTAMSRARVPIPDGAPPPSPPRIVLDQLEAQAARTLDGTLESIQAGRRAKGEQEREALIANLAVQLDEVTADLRANYAVAKLEPLQERRAQLLRAVEQARRSEVTSDAIELRAELLALEFHGSRELDLVEEWKHAGGHLHTLIQRWPGKLAALTYQSAASGAALVTFALCAEGHLAEAADVAQCTWCARDSCAACAAQARVAACLTCDQEACPDCRSRRGLCRDCDKPIRAPELDTAWERGWLLGGGRSLLVGERHAVLTKGDSRVDVVPDADVADPVRCKVRALARKLQLPLGSGLVTAGQPEADLTTGSVWSRVDRSVWWDDDPGGGSAIDLPGAADLPEAPVPEVSGEVQVRLDDLLPRLRREVPPPTAPALRRRPLVVTRRVRIDHETLRFEELRQQDDDTPVLADSANAEFQSSQHLPIDDGRALASAQVGPVRVEVDGLHRSFVTTLTGAGVTTTAFLPDAEGVSFDGERRWARWVSSYGLPPTSVVCRQGSIPPEPPATETSGVVSVERTITQALLLVDGGGLPARDADLGGTATVEALAPTDAAVASVDPATCRGLRDALRGFDAGTTQVAMATGLFVDERWRSPHGSTLRQFSVCTAVLLDSAELRGRTLVTAGAALVPTLDVPDSTPGPLTVDSRDHLVVAATSTACPVCAKLSCPACGPVGAVQECDECRRAACGECRTARWPALDATCARCGDFACSACSRQLPLSACAICLRDVCNACTRDSLCGTCRNLKLATPEQVSELPAQLRALGLVVRVGTDPAGDRVALLVGHHRLEVALVRGQAVLRWVTLTDDGPELLSARLTFAAHAGTGDVDVVVLHDPPPTTRPGGLSIANELIESTTWAVHRGSELVHQRLPLPQGGRIHADRDFLTALVGASRHATGLVPQHHPNASSIRAHLRSRSLLNQDGAVPAVVTAGQFRSQEIVLVTADGLLHWVAEGSEVTAQTIPWMATTHAAPMAWATGGWAPEPDVIAACEGFGVQAALVCVGEHTTLGVRSLNGDVSWHDITERSTDLSRMLTGEVLLGRRALVSISSAVDPAAVEWPRVLGATRRARHIEPLVLDASHAPTADEARELRTVLDAHAAGIRHIRPATATIDDTFLSNALSRWFRGHPSERLLRAVGLSVTEEWISELGGLMTVHFTIPPGSTQGLIRDEVTGQQMPAVSSCRNSHLTNLLGRCRYCEGDTCPHCTDLVTLCTVCAIPVCGLCRDVGHPDRCRVCGSLEELGMLERRRAGLSLNGRAWVANDSRGHVVVKFRKGLWEVNRFFDNHDLSAPMSAAHSMDLEQLLHNRAR